jgi:hypothetical protein
LLPNKFSPLQALYVIALFQSLLSMSACFTAKWQQLQQQQGVTPPSKAGGGGGGAAAAAAASSGSGGKAKSTGGGLGASGRAKP